jgi:hypothetical protein
VKVQLPTRVDDKPTLQCQADCFDAADSAVVSVVVSISGCLQLVPNLIGQQAPLAVAATLANARKAVFEGPNVAAAQLQKGQGRLQASEDAAEGGNQLKRGSPHCGQHRQAAYTLVTCAACAGVHMVNTKSRKVLRGSDERPRAHRPGPSTRPSALLELAFYFLCHDQNPNLFRDKNTKNRKTSPNRIDEEITYSGVPRR